MTDDLPSLTNEELAMLAKAGDEASLLQLWEENKSLYATIIHRHGYALFTKKNYAVDMDDLQQAAFLGVQRSVRYYDPGKGVKWSTIVGYFIRQECAEALGFRGRTREEHYRCLSLSTPLSNDGEGFTIGDTLQDLSLPEMTEELEREDIRKVISGSLAELPKQEAALLREVFINKRSLASLSDGTQVDRRRLSQQYEAALRKISGNKKLQALAKEEELSKRDVPRGNAWESDFMAMIEHNLSGEKKSGPGSS